MHLDAIHIAGDAPTIREIHPFGSSAAQLQSIDQDRFQRQMPSKTGIYHGFHSRWHAIFSKHMNNAGTDEMIAELPNSPAFNHCSKYGDIPIVRVGILPCRMT